MKYRNPAVKFITRYAAAHSMLKGICLSVLALSVTIIAVSVVATTVQAARKFAKFDIVLNKASGAINVEGLKPKTIFRSWPTPALSTST